MKWMKSTLSVVIFKSMRVQFFCPSRFTPSASMLTATVNHFTCLSKISWRVASSAFIGTRACSGCSSEGSQPSYYATVNGEGSSSSNESARSAVSVGKEPQRSPWCGLFFSKAKRSMKTVADCGSITNHQERPISQSFHGKASRSVS